MHRKKAQSTCEQRREWHEWGSSEEQTEIMESIKRESEKERKRKRERITNHSLFLNGGRLVIGQLRSIRVLLEIRI